MQAGKNIKRIMRAVRASYGDYVTGSEANRSEIRSIEADMMKGKPQSRQRDFE